MLARLQRTLVLTFCALAAGVLLAALATGHGAWAAVGLLWALSGHALALAAIFVLMARVNRDDPAPRATWRQWVAAWWGEVTHAPRVFCWRQPFRSHAWPDQLAGRQPGQRGLVLIHGFFCNRGVWNRWYPRLRALGIPFVAVNLEPVFASIDDYQGLIEAAVQRIESSTGRAPVIVAHSMGGLAARRWWAAAHPGRIRRLITIGTPHHGTWLARWARSSNALEMRRTSSWREQLERGEPAASRGSLTCFYSHCDNIVFPASTATVEGADNRHLPAVAHVHMVDHPAPFDEAVRWVTEGAGKAAPSSA